MKPLRVALFAPGIRQRVMDKALDSGADAVIFDLEDSVPVASKAEARVLVGKAIDAVAVAAGTRAWPALFVRVNNAQSGMLDDDLAAVARPGLNAVLLPKIETLEEVRHTAALLDRHEIARGMPAGSVEIVLSIESALGVYRCYDLIRASSRVTATCIGSAQDGDLQADLGCGWSVEGMELMYARSKVLLDSRAAGGHIVPLDGVFSNLDDEEALIRDSTLCARLGYVGRTVIHPRQIAPVRKAYAVPAAQVAYYEKVVSEFEAAEKNGAAAITVEGKLVDYAMYHRAKRVLELARLDR